MKEPPNVFFNTKNTQKEIKYKHITHVDLKHLVVDEHATWCCTYIVAKNKFIKKSFTQANYTSLFRSKVHYEETSQMRYS